MLLEYVFSKSNAVFSHHLTVCRGGGLYLFNRTFLFTSIRDFKRVILHSGPCSADGLVLLCSACSFTLKVITYINEARRRGLSPRSLVHCLLIIVLDEQLRGDALPVESCSESCSVFTERKIRNKLQNEAND